METVCLTNQICLAGGDFVVAIGILISGGLAIWSLAWTSRLQKDQNRLAEEQNELLAEQNEIARRQLEAQSPTNGLSPTTHTSSPPNAKFQVRLTPSGRSQRIVVQNVGPGAAHNVRLEVDPPDDLVGGSPQDFPRLDPGQEWRLLFARSLASPDRYHWKLTWIQHGNTETQDGWVSPP